MATWVPWTQSFPQKLEKPFIKKLAREALYFPLSVYHSIYFCRVWNSKIDM